MLRKTIPIRERTESSIAREKEIEKQNCIREQVFLSSQYEYNDAWNACTGEVWSQDFK